MVVTFATADGRTFFEFRGFQPRFRPSSKCAMRNRATLYLFALVAIVSLLHVPPAFAGYGTVTYDQEGRKQGFAWDEPSQERANEIAKRDCGSDACKVRFGVGPKMCAALAPPDPGPAWGGAVRKSVDAAKLAALKNFRTLTAQGADTPGGAQLHRQWPYDGRFRPGRLAGALRRV